MPLASHKQKESEPLGPLSRPGNPDPSFVYIMLLYKAFVNWEISEFGWVS
jgi:hypothetical protein